MVEDSNLAPLRMEFTVPLANPIAFNHTMFGAERESRTRIRRVEAYNITFMLSPAKFGTPYGHRTRFSRLKVWYPSHVDEWCLWRKAEDSNPKPFGLICLANSCDYPVMQYFPMAEEEGFEPPQRLGQTVFKTVTATQNLSVYSSVLSVVEGRTIGIRASTTAACSSPCL